MIVNPFDIAIPDAVLDDLRSRLARTRYPARTGGSPWSAGADPDYLRDLLSYWADGFDWRAQERRLNALPHRIAEIRGQRVHFIHAPGVRAPGGPAPLPLILSHGWPSSVIEMLPMVPLLTDPGAHGGDPADAFDVVVPSIPGFLYSDPPPDGPVTAATIARTWRALMADVLGYRRFGAFGGDIGGLTTARLGSAYPDHVVGVHQIHPSFPAGFPDDVDPGRPVTSAEQSFLDRDGEVDEADRGYSEIQGTRPDTIATALLDSPAGLAAWILDKWRDWSDCHGDLDSRFDRDDLLTMLTLYWATGSIGTSFRWYHDWAQQEVRRPVTVPAAFTLSAEFGALGGFPRELAERAYTDIRLWHEPDRGGHFMPMEEPGLLVEDLRSFFRPLR